VIDLDADRLSSGRGDERTGMGRTPLPDLHRNSDLLLRAIGTLDEQVYRCDHASVAREVESKERGAETRKSSPPRRSLNQDCDNVFIPNHHTDVALPEGVLGKEDGSRP
jgi:hypothetical protein